MIDTIIFSDIIHGLFVLILGTAALIITQRSLSSLFNIYAVQSFILAVMAIVLFIENGTLNLLFIALLTLAVKTIFIPLFLHRVLKRMPVKRDLQFSFLSPASSIIISTILLFVVYLFFTNIAGEVFNDSLILLGGVIGISLILMGMMVIFSRKRVITKTIGYLTMENGVLLFSLFMAEMPFIIEFLIVIDLLMILVLSAVLAFGIDSSLEEFHKKLNRLGIWVED
ncbi:MAG: hydrogenase subunit [Dehalococcoidales bacterium]|jgi:hydrogenase-4 component E|nr:hydrogenase subunit [Dehalococcoidales bacterium]